MRSKHLSAKESQAVIVEAVIGLAGAKNPDEITTAAIAQHMDLTQGALFRHFPTKALIWQAVMAWFSERLLARIDYASKAIVSPLKAMQAIANGELQPSLDSEAAAALFVQSLLTGDLKRMRKDAPRVFAIYRRGIGVSS